MKLRKTLTGIVLMGALALSGCGTSTNDNGRVDSVYSIKTYGVDQVFRDHNGWRVYHTDDNKVLLEEKFYDGGSTSHLYPLPEISDEDNDKFTSYGEPRVKVVKDLNEGEKTKVIVLNYQYYTGAMDRGNVDAYFVEIHMPENGKISAGNESWGGKFRQNAPMTEIE